MNAQYQKKYQSNPKNARCISNKYSKQEGHLGMDELEWNFKLEPISRHIFNTGCSFKIVFFSQFTATHSLHEGEQSNSSDLRFECTGTVFGRPFSVQPIAAQWWLGRGRKILTIFWKKTQYLINTMYLQCFCPIF